MENEISSIAKVNEITLLNNNQLNKNLFTYSTGGHVYNLIFTFVAINDGMYKKLFIYL